MCARVPDDARLHTSGRALGGMPSVVILPYASNCDDWQDAEVLRGSVSQLGAMARRRGPRSREARHRPYYGRGAARDRLYTDERLRRQRGRRDCILAVRRTTSDEWRGLCQKRAPQDGGPVVPRPPRQWGFVCLASPTQPGRVSTACGGTYPHRAATQPDYQHHRPSIPTEVGTPALWPWQSRCGSPPW